MNLVIAISSLLAALHVNDPDSARLLASWPVTGPPQVLRITGLGNGYSSPAISGDRIFVTGETGKTGYLYAFDLAGNLVWEKTYGEEFTVSFPGSRAAPVVVDSLVYIVSGTADITCFEARAGARKWMVSCTGDLGGVNPIFGYSMRLLIDEEKLFCSPGGAKNNVVALNRFTGDLIWCSPAKGETAGYGSPLLIELPARKLLVTACEFNILGLDAGTGDLLWSYGLAFKGDVPCNTPSFDGKSIYWVAGPGNGAVAARLSPDGSKIDMIWKNIEFDTSFGNFVRIGTNLFGCSNTQRKFVTVDCKTGRIMKSVNFGIGSVIPAGDRLIAYNQRGYVGLIRPGEGKPELVSSFQITPGTGEHFSHPVISGGRLYIRHGDALLAFSINADQ